MTILITEDDYAIMLGLKYYLEEENFKVLEAKTGIEAINQVMNNHIDLILLDINLPDIDGFGVLKRVKKIKDIPIIFLSANDLELSIVNGLDMGADDYITKPFKAKELLSRIKTVLRRKGTVKDNIIDLENIQIDVNQAKVLKNKEVVFLTALEYKILLVFALNPKKVFTRESILSTIWDVNEEFVNDNTLTVYIKRIREKIELDPTNPKIIKTVRGVGYKLGEFNE